MLFSVSRSSNPKFPQAAKEAKRPTAVVWDGPVWAGVALLWPSVAICDLSVGEDRRVWPA